MLPSLYRRVPAMPLNLNGKIDRSALPEVTFEASSTTLKTSFKTTVNTTYEQRVAAVWQRVLGVPAIGLDENFFDAGGTSLLLIAARAGLEQEFTRSLPITVDVRVHHRAHHGRALAAGRQTCRIQRLALQRRPAPASSRPMLQANAGKQRQAFARAQGPAPRRLRSRAMSQTDLLNEPDDRMQDGVAIIGMAGRFPGAADIREFWANLLAGKDTITRFSKDELEARNAGAGQGEDYVAARGILADVDMFDADYFGIAPREADRMDPQHRLFLEACSNALEDAGYVSADYPGEIGLFAGCSLNTYLLANLAADRATLDELTGQYQVGEFQIALGNDKDFLTTRAAYKLNLRGPVVSVQSACATSLVAVCQAAQSLMNYACDMALAGGVSATFPQHRGHVYQEGGIVSRDGRCRPFDADGDRHRLRPRRGCGGAEKAWKTRCATETTSPPSSAVSRSTTTAPPRPATWRRAWTGRHASSPPRRPWPA